MKFALNSKGVLGEAAAQGGVGATGVGETSEVWPEELSGGERVNKQGKWL